MSTTLPQTVQEAVFILVKDLDEDIKANLLAADKEDLKRFHIGWAASIRSRFGLWGQNPALLEDTGEPHPDSASMVIVHAVWSYLQEEV
ncbi:MAG: hypothetical protein CL920_31440 [Deltaproteobacteria bacterium]|nr:hypothetical protein [Deltaproteobacteria bacterium]|tara:strand:- start:12748 stop:13014 length:267 start_codon:yes stop_codon:yes gene_type:complete